jgi:phage host-nuclease inhibitor protein Gam
VEETTKAVATQANDMIKELAHLDREANAKEAVLNRRLQEVRDELGPAVEELKKKRDAAAESLKQLVTPHFNELVKPGTKTVYLRNGEISQRAGSEALELLIPEKQVIAQIRRAKGVRRFIRRKEELDKVALKKNPAFVSKIPGLAIVRKTSLIIKPAKSQGEIVLSPSPVVISQPEED